MNLLYEDMIRVETPVHICRIWREHHLFPRIGDNDKVRNDVHAWLLLSRDLKETATWIVEIDKVNSVEIISRETGCGICVHKDWP
jgi:hypothetical protein